MRELQAFVGHTRGKNVDTFQTNLCFAIMFSLVVWSWPTSSGKNEKAVKYTVGEPGFFLLKMKQDAWFRTHDPRNSMHFYRVLVGSSLSSHFLMFLLIPSKFFKVFLVFVWFSSTLASKESTKSSETNQGANVFFQFIPVIRCSFIVSSLVRRSASFS